MKKLSTGDMMHVYGSFGLKNDYTVRLVLRLVDEVDGEMLKEAINAASRRYPYLLLKMKRNENEIYYEENDEPVAVLKQKESVTLGAAETNYHMWALCYYGDKLYFDFYHGLCDGTGMYMVLSTILYYYTNKKYGVTDHTGIRTLEDEIKPQEYIDPLDALPEIDLSAIPTSRPEPAFMLIEDGGFTPCDQKLYDVVIPEKDFVRFSSANDASPGIMVSVLLARAVDRLFPEREKEIRSSYVMNARPMLGANETHHNCITTVFLDYSDKIKAMPFDRQCTVYRGKTFVQSDDDRVRKAMTVSSSRFKAVAKTMPGLEDKMKAYGMIMAGGKDLFTFLVSYVGKWKYPSVGKYINEFWTHVPRSNRFLVEIAAINGKIFLTIHQAFEEDTLLKAFEEELKENGISCHITELENDVAFLLHKEA